MDAEAIIEQFGLKPHPEGGFYSETYRCDETIPSHLLSRRYRGDRNLGSAILYLLTTDTFSAMHRLITDEIFHFYYGDPVDILVLFPEGNGETVTLGTDLAGGHSPQVVVSGGCWQGLSLASGGRFALMGTTMAPAFDFDDFELGDRYGLMREYPDFAPLIERLTRA